MELIVNILGTPTKEELGKISNPDKRETLLKNGKLEKKLNDLFPGVSEDGK